MHGTIVKTAIGAVGCFCAFTLAAPTYFLVAEPDFAQVHGDSFVLPLTDPDHIAHARDLILRGPEKAGEPIVFAEIGAGSGNGINRDLRDPAESLWNWHVTGVHGFGDMGIELLDGWPTYVAQNRASWFSNTGAVPETGRIGFWSYTVVAELPSHSPIPPAAMIPLPSGLSGGIITVGLIGVGWAYRRYRKARVAQN